MRRERVKYPRGVWIDPANEDKPRIEQRRFASYQSEERNLLRRDRPPDGYKVNTMVNEMTRSRVIQSWFVAVTLVAVASIAVGVSVTLSTGAILLALSVVPPTIVLMLWPGPQPATAADVLYGSDRRG